MSFQILDIVLYSHDRRRRVLALRPGDVNIITGASKTGKTALIDIVDYCLGSDSCGVPEGPIRRAVAWVGLRLLLTSGQAFVARRIPGSGRESTAEVFFAVGASLIVPEATELGGTTNIDTLRALLAEAAGIGANVHEPPASQTRLPLTANLRHALAFTFQPQFEINQPEYLFHRQSDSWVGQAIKDTLPFFLGAVDDDHVAKKSRLRDLRQQLRDRERRLAIMESVKGQGLGKAAALLAEARDAGLIEQGPTPAGWPEAVDMLRPILGVPAELPLQGMDLGQPGVALQNLMNERDQLQEQLRRARDELETARAVISEERGYSRELGEQVARLKSLGVLPRAHERPLCPLCESPLPTSVPAVAELRAALDQSTEQLERVGRRSPQLQAVVGELEERVTALRLRLSENREALEAIRASSERIRRMSDASARRALVVGRISLYLESLPEVADTSSLRLEIDGLRAQVHALEEELSDERVRERIESILAIIGTKMTAWARVLRLNMVAWMRDHRNRAT